MSTLIKDRILQWVTVLTFVLMVAINGLANALPINGVNSGEVSDSYPNLFAPIGFTFSIWGVIYTLLLIYTVYQLLAFFREGFDKGPELRRINLYYSAGSVINAAWIFAWHYRQIGISLILMMGILVSLIGIAMIQKDMQWTMRTYVVSRLPFSIYFGWITVAAVANVTTFLVSVGWNRFGIDEALITVVILIVAAVIGIAAIRFYGDMAYGTVFLWAYSGILAKHLSPSFFKGQYVSVIWTLALLLGVIAVFEVITFMQLRNKAA